MGRCYSCSQENCGRLVPECTCSCHGHKDLKLTPQKEVKIQQGVPTGTLKNKQGHKIVMAMTATMPDCARCDGSHENVPVKQFGKPLEAGGEIWTHYLHCPTTGEPVIIQVTPMKELEKSESHGD